MSNERLEKLMNINITIALVFIMIIKGKVGFLGGVIFGAIGMIIGLMCIKKGIHKKPEIIEVIFLVGGLIIAIPMYYIFEFIKIDNKILIVTIIAVSMIWLFGGLLILYIRKRRRERK